MVHDVNEAVSFYTRHLGFEVIQQFGPNMAILSRGSWDIVRPALCGVKTRIGGKRTMPLKRRVELPLCHRPSRNEPLRVA